MNSNFLQDISKNFGFQPQLYFARSAYKNLEFFIILSYIFFIIKILIKMTTFAEIEYIMGFLRNSYGRTSCFKETEKVAGDFTYSFIAIHFKCL